MASWQAGDCTARQRAARAPGMGYMSSSMVSDCYSSDEDCTDLCKDSIINWSCDQRASSVMNLSRGVAHHNDQCGDGGCSLLHVRKDSPWNKVQFLRDPSHASASNNGYASPFRESSCVSADNEAACEFYRPPSEMRTGFNEALDIVENASTVAHYYSEPRAATRSPIEYAGFANNADELDVVPEQEHDGNTSGFLFPSSSLIQDSLGSTTGGALLGLFGGGALASRSQSEVAIGNDLPLYEDQSRNYSPDFIHSVSCRVPVLTPVMKSTSAQFSSLRLLEQAVQTSRNSLYQRAPPKTLQDVAASPVWSGAASALAREHIANQPGQLEHKQQSEEGDLYRCLYEALDTVESHVDAICRVGPDQWTGRESVAIGQDDPDGGDCSRRVKKDSGSIYPTQLVEELRRRTKDICRRLECRLGVERAAPEKPRRRQRHYSEVPGRQRDQLFSAGDYAGHPDLVQTREKILLPKSPVERAELLPGGGELPDYTCRVFELSPYDDLVRSFQSSTDRRIKAVGNRMKCTISMEGPLRIFDSTSSCWNMRDKLAYSCSISGTSREAVDKCLKCLQDTFPQSYLNERHPQFSCRPPDRRLVLS